MTPKAKEVVGIEINPEGHRYGLENLKINKIRNARLCLGDVRKVVPELNEKFDRILMPLPKSAEDFLDVALSASKKGTVIHFYDFLFEEEIPKKAVEKIKRVCKSKNIKCKKI
jgi:tRNA (guanine37-N1)-methyltransferase